MFRIVKTTGWILMLLHASMVALFSLRYFTLNPNIAASLNGRSVIVRAILLVHVFGGVIALFVGPYQFWATLREKYLRLHRSLGKIYLLAVLIGSVAGLFMAFVTQGGAAAQTGFGILAVLWLITGIRAYQRIRAGDIQSHREWMIRNYALTFAAGTLRVWFLPLAMLGFNFIESYRIVAWLCWIPNLILVELYITAVRAKAKEMRIA